MDVIVNQKCSFKPETVEFLTSQGMAILNFLAVLGYDASQLPLADLYKTQKNLKGDWAILTPVYWRVTHNDAMIVDQGEALQLTESEARSCFQCLLDHYANENNSFFYYDKNNWLINIDEKPALKAQSVFKIIGRSLMPELAQLDSTLFWQKWFTECQMLFASHLILSKVNGIWVWGTGHLTQKKHLTVCVDETFFPLADLCCDQVVLYNPSLNLGGFQMILLNDFNKLSPSHQKELMNAPAVWYWNDLAYSLASTNWFIRIWRYLTHAH